MVSTARDIFPCRRLSTGLSIALLLIISLTIGLRADTHRQPTFSSDQLDTTCQSDQIDVIQSNIDSRNPYFRLPAGCLAISRPIVLHSWLPLEGSRKRLTVIRPLPNFVGVAAIVIGTNDNGDDPNRRLVFDGMVSSMTVDMINAPTRSCVAMMGAQEGSGIRDFLCIGLHGPETDAITISGNTNRVALRDIEIYPPSPIRNALSVTAYCGCTIDEITIVGAMSPVGLFVKDADINLRVLHCEQVISCIAIHGINTTGVLSSISGPTSTFDVDDLVSVYGDVQKLHLGGLVKNGARYLIHNYMTGELNESPYLP